MKFYKKIVSVLAIFYGVVAREESELRQFCQTDLAECKCEYYLGTLMMDCSEMGIEEMPNFSEDKVNAMFFHTINNVNSFLL